MTEWPWSHTPLESGMSLAIGTVQKLAKNILMLINSCLSETSVKQWNVVNTEQPCYDIFMFYFSNIHAKV